MHGLTPAQRHALDRHLDPPDFVDQPGPTDAEKKVLKAYEDLGHAVDGMAIAANGVEDEAFAHLSERLYDIILTYYADIQRLKEPND